MKFDLYDFLKLKDKSQQLFVENNPHIYIYGDIIIDLEFQHVLELKNPDKESLFDQIGNLTPADGVNFVILDSMGNRLYNEISISYDPRSEYDYDYNVKEYNHDGWLIKSHMRDRYIDYVYDTRNNVVVATLYNKDCEVLLKNTYGFDVYKHNCIKKVA